MSSLDKEKFFSENTSNDEYSISEDEFLEAPKKIEKYLPGSKINRQNFNDFLIKSFALSQGFAHSQMLLMQWLKTHESFDYSKTWDNFIEAGGWQALSEEEKENFTNAFERIRAHDELTKDGPNVSTLAREEFEAQTARMSVTHPFDPTAESKLKSLLSFEEFAAFLKDENARLRASRKRG